MQNEQFSGQASLDLIQSMINRARNQFGENGHLYLVWGWAILICSVAQFVLKYFYSYEHHYIVWMFTWVILIYQTIYLVKNRKKEKVKTYTGDILGNVWLVFVVLMVTIGFIVGRAGENADAGVFTPVLLALYGMPTYLSGKILQFRPLVLGGISCWVLALISLFIPSDFVMLMFGVAVIAAWIIPGYLLKNKFNMENT
jgi:hypothetical protein